MVQELIIYPAVYLGIVIGLYELLLIHRDVNFRGSHWFGHGFHAIGFIIMALFLTMNAEFAYSYFGFLQGIPLINNPFAFRIFIGLILLVKIHTVSAVVPKAGIKGMRETWTHSLIITGLVILMPYIWPFIEPVVRGMLPGL